MPDQPTWLERVPEILAVLQASASPPFLDRPDVERLFGVRRRQAIELMHHMAGYQIGRTFLVGRESVLAFLNQARLREAAARAVQRKQRIADYLERARHDLAARSIRIHVRPGDRRPGLPEGVELRRGELNIRFEDPMELLQKLFQLSQVLARDYHGVLNQQLPLPKP